MQFDSDDDDDHRGKAFTQKKTPLFDDDNDEALNAGAHFEAKKIPKKRKKLQDLQARLTTTNDPRFQFSEQFLDDRDHNNGDGEDDDEPMDQEEISFEDEKNKSLAILDQITQAKPVVTKEKTRMIRFDPSKTEHRIYELGSRVDTNGHQGNFSEPKSILKAVKPTAPVM